MGCTCGYNTDNKTYGFDECNDKKFNPDPSKQTLNDDLIRVTSMSRISSQRSVMLNNLKRNKEQREPMKIDIIGFADQILEEYNLARTNPKFYSYKVKTFQEKLEKDYNAKEPDMYYFKNSSGTKIVLRNAMKICREIVNFLENQNPLKPLLKDDILIITAKKGLENIKANKGDRLEQLKSIYTTLGSSSEEKTFSSIVGFGDYDPSLIVTLQIIDHKDDGYPRSCIFNEEMNYCGVYAVESDKLKIVAMSNFMN
mmetsp:Transcript_26878/g.27918  ORF Transcript_26878/g.27918 Transcript_26878/m.27918 type:complete len:255 (+) Transcript_26878:16-780(+)